MTWYGGSFAWSRMYRPNTASTSMDLGVSQAFAAQPNLLHKIEITQKVWDAPLVQALHEQCRMLTCTPAGVAPGDKEWNDLVQQFTTTIGTVNSESNIPAYCFKIFREMKHTKGGMLLLNYVTLKALN